MEESRSPSYAFHIGYVDDKVWSEELAEEYEYIRVSEDLIEKTRKIVYKEGSIIKIKGSKYPLGCLFKGNFVRTSFYLPSEQPPLYGPEIGLYSKTEKDLEKLVKELRLPEPDKSDKSDDSEDSDE